MNKKLKLWIVLIFAIMIAISGAICLFLIAKRTNMTFATEAQVRFVYGDTNISSRLDEKELNEIKAIFEDKRMYRDNPSCGFSENISITFNESQTFCIACDTCPVVYWVEKDKYFRLTEQEKTQLYNLLESHGFYFPCT